MGATGKDGPKIESKPTWKSVDDLSDVGMTGGITFSSGSAMDQMQQTMEAQREAIAERNRIAGEK